MDPNIGLMVTLGLMSSCANSGYSGYRGCSGRMRLKTNKRATKRLRKLREKSRKRNRPLK